MGAGGTRRRPGRRRARGFSRRAHHLLVVAVGLGATSTAAGIVLQGATAAGTSFWGALDPAVISGVVDTRLGGVWALRLGIWLLLGGGLVALALVRVTLPALAVAPSMAVAAAGGARRPADSGRGARAPRPPGPGAAAHRGHVALTIAGGGLALTPALSGHARSQSPAALLVPADVIHVVAMSAWLGGLAFLLAAVPAATRALAPPERTRLLAAALGRFSSLALLSVLALAATGTLQAIFEVRTLERAHRHRLRPRRARQGRAAARADRAGRAEPPAGRAGAEAPDRRRRRARGRRPALRRTLRAEVGLIVAVLAVTGALTGYPPPTAAATGPVSMSQRLGPLDLDLTIDPARTGVNEVHLYLFRAATGAPFTGTKELTVRARMPGRASARSRSTRARPAPATTSCRRATLSPGGDWEILIADRVSEFDEYSTTAEVTVR